MPTATRIALSAKEVQSRAPRSGSAIFPEPQSFFWLPIAGQRHAAGVRDRDLPYGELIDTLCGQQLKRAPVTELEWLWPTCPACWTTTAARVGLRA